jgi:hypothetical protein
MPVRMFLDLYVKPPTIELAILRLVSLASKYSVEIYATNPAMMESSRNTRIVKGVPSQINLAKTAQIAIVMTDSHNVKSI